MESILLPPRSYTRVLADLRSRQDYRAMLLKVVADQLATRLESIFIDATGVLRPSDPWKDVPPWLIAAIQHEDADIVRLEYELREACYREHE
jgi:hypothetical protein